MLQDSDCEIERSMKAKSQLNCARKYPSHSEVKTTPMSTASPNPP